MLELLAYLRANGFKTFIVSGGGIEFMRPWVEKVYGIPPEQVVGSYGKLQWEMQDGRPVLRKLPDISLVDDEAGQARGNPDTHRPAADRGVRQLGRRPADAAVDRGGQRARVSACTSTTPTPRASGRTIAHRSIGRLDKGLDEAKARGAGRW